MNDTDKDKTGATELPTTAARQAQTTGRVRYILLVSTGVAAIALGLLLLGWII
jgi:hypothetical protein